MPLENSFSASPYFDDYDQNKDFYKILFKPSVAVQARELNQLQTILQNQVERFGDHVFKSGTVVSGVNFTYLPSYNYIKILDTQNDGLNAVPSSYVDFFIRSNLNLTARVVNYEDGLETQTPNLKTLYIQYIRSSDEDTANTNAVYDSFAPNEQLTIFSKQNKLFQYNVVAGGTGFSNSDSLVVLSALKLNGNNYSFQAGERVTQATTGAKAIIKSVNTTAFANSTILTIKPLNSDLTASNTGAWAFSAGYNIVGNISLASASVANIVGEGAQGIIRTDSLGIVTSVTLTEGGAGYEVLPHVTINTSNTTAGLSTLDITPQNYKAIVTVGNSSINSVGAGYAFGVTEGIIYQKGHFLRVAPQVIVIDKYSTLPNNVSVGFKTVETVIDSNADSSLFDNASNTTNFAAPGADRLKLTPVLTKLTVDQASANVDFFTLAEWKDGNPYKENRITIYNQLADQFARRTVETNGNYVVNPFVVTTKENSTPNVTHIRTLVDPGLGYVEGYRVQTRYNNYIDQERSVTTTSLTSQQISVNYGNYVKVNELSGYFDFKSGDVISLRSDAKDYVSGVTLDSTSITPPGSEIGTARIRSLVIDSGDPGTPSCVYRVYLFDIAMNAGFSFRDVRSIWYNGTIYDGVADVVLETDTTTAASVAVLKDTTLDKMLFNVGRRGVKTINNIRYTYRTISDTSSLQLGTGGTLTIGPLGSGLEFPYGGELSSTEKKDFIIIPLSNNQASSNLAGGISTTSGSANVTGTSTTFASSLSPGDFVKFANSSASVIGQVKFISNNTHLVLNASLGSTISGNAVLFFPALYPILLENRDDRSINIDTPKTSATIDLNQSLSGTVNAVAVYNVSRVNAPPVGKVINRDIFVKILTSNNETSNTGPWALGVPGVARLKNVYLGDSTTVNTNSTDVTKYFYIDVGDDENAYRSSRLVLQKNSGLNLTTNQYVLVKFDAFTTNGIEGFFTCDSYNVDDTKTLSESSSTINTLEIPETVTSRGQYYDLRDVMDFRPYGTATATITTDPSTATINPSSSFNLSGDDQLFPAPDAQVTFDIEYYNFRRDSVTVDKRGSFKVNKGIASLDNPILPRLQPGTMTLSNLVVPPYPSLPLILNSTTLEFLAKRTGDEKGVVNRRQGIFSVRPIASNSRFQPRRYSMADIGRLDRRVTQLEYSVALSLAERAIKDLSIPSGITPTTERFKNAFFVDSFTDHFSADVSHMEYSASIDESSSLLRPPIRQVNVESVFDRTDAETAAAIVNSSTLMLPYTEETLISQQLKSSVVGSDGIKVQFVGEGSVDPPSFSINVRAEVVVTREQAVTPAPVNQVGNTSVQEVGIAPIIPIVVASYDYIAHSSESPGGAPGGPGPGEGSPGLSGGPGEGNVTGFEGYGLGVATAEGMAATNGQSDTGAGADSSGGNASDGAAANGSDGGPAADGADGSY